MEDGMNWYLEVLKKYAVFSGRARRKEYWMFWLFNWIIGFVLYFIENIAGIAPESGRVLMILYTLAVLLPTLAVAVRRLHDTGRSGWWLLIMLAVAVRRLHDPGRSGWWLLTSFVAIIGGIVLLVFLVQDSQPAENQYGPNPKAAAADPDR
jgi:uncharacterized membrane protein YhaH (DUF805 family)